MALEKSGPWSRAQHAFLLKDAGLSLDMAYGRVFESYLSRKSNFFFFQRTKLEYVG